jgi:hypothetical protein
MSVLRTAAILVALLAIGGSALAQSGSTGGTLGKSGKSLSGGVEKQSPPTPNPQRSTPAGAPVKVARVFSQPTHQGIRIDGCLRWGPQGCGEPAATRWCRLKGFSVATAWETENVNPTIFLDPASSVKTCEFFFCGSFKQITCE